MSTAVTVRGIGKAYQLGLKDEIPDTLVSAMAAWVRAPFRNFQRLRSLDTYGRNVSGEGVIWALKDVSFDIEQGEVLGIIGRNGAGKSTLLKVLSRITEPTAGRATIRGRVSSLLEVGTGFHPELTGRENIYMNGTILGMTKREIDRKFDEIVDFSGVEAFLDTPSKRYSSGMQVRLAFAVAAHLEPEILIVDEVLAVGDAAFQKKCVGKMQSVASDGRTVLFVSHNMAAVESLCTKAIEIKAGRLHNSGDVESVIASYLHSSADSVKRAGADRLADAKIVKEVDVLDARGNPTSIVPLGGPFRVRLVLNSDRCIRNPTLGLGFDSLFGQRILTVRSPVTQQVLKTIESPTEVICAVPEFPLGPGEYTLSITLLESKGTLEVLPEIALFEVVDGDAFGEGRGFHKGLCVARSEWQQTGLEVTEPAVSDCQS